MTDYLPEYKRKIKAPLVTAINSVLMGDIVLFPYDGRERLVLVVSPKYQDKLHGIMLNEVMVEKYRELMRRVGPKMALTIASKNSVALYQFVYPFVKQLKLDNYRSFDRAKIQSPIKRFCPVFNVVDGIITFPNGSIVIGEDRANKVFITSASYYKYVLPLLTTNAGVYYEGRKRRLSKEVENLLNASLLNWRLITTWEPKVKQTETEKISLQDRAAFLLEMARTHRGIYFAGIECVILAKALQSEDNL